MAVSTATASSVPATITTSQMADGIVVRPAILGGVADADPAWDAEQHSDQSREQLRHGQPVVVHLSSSAPNIGFIALAAVLVLITFVGRLGGRPPGGSGERSARHRRGTRS